MSARPMNDVSILLDEVYYPILSNPSNQEGWPDVIRKDVDLHIQDLRNTIAEVRIESAYVKKSIKRQ
jgi:dynein heavy chain, axonemal